MAVASKTWSVGEVVPAAGLNTYLRDNLSDLQTNKVVMKSGTYTGDGTLSQEITGVGFTPIFVWIVNRATVHGTEIEILISSTTIIDDEGEGGAINLGDALHEFVKSHISALGSDGFTVDDAGNNGHPNKDGTIYNYVAFGAE